MIGPKILLSLKKYYKLIVSQMNTKQIKYLVMDVDGTLTDGKIYMGVNGEVMKAFSIKDGLAIHEYLPQAGILPLIITGRCSSIVQNRCKELGIVDLYQGVSDKSSTLCHFLEEHNGKLAEVAYAGDDINDLPCMQMVKSNGGLVCVPNDACRQVKDIADYVSSLKGGDGAVREIIEWLME